MANKTIFSFDIDVNDLEGAVKTIVAADKAIAALKKSLANFANTDSSLTDLVKPLKDTNTELEDLKDNLDSIDDSQIKKTTTAMQKLRDIALQVNNKFKDIASTVRNLASNVFGKFMGVLKGALMGLTAIVGAVTAAFNLANGTGRTVTEGGFAGLSYAEQRGLNNANNETGFNADFATHRMAFNEGATALEAAATLSNAGITQEEFDKLAKDSRSYYKINDKLYEAYKQILANSSDRYSANETFKQIYEEKVLQPMGYGNAAQFIQANEQGIVSRHRERFEATVGHYSSIDAQALLKGEKALDDFSETIKSFALTVASKVLPSLTKGLKSITNLFKSVSKYAKESRILESVSNALTSFIEFIMAVGEKIAGWANTLFGGSLTEHLKDNFDVFNNLFKGATAWVKDDEENSKKYFNLANEGMQKVTGNLIKGAGDLIESSVESLTGIKVNTEPTQRIANLTNNVADSTIAGFMEGYDNAPEGTSMMGRIREGFNTAKEKALQDINIYVEGRKAATVRQEITNDPLKGIENQGKLMEKARL